LSVYTCILISAFKNEVDLEHED